MGTLKENFDVFINLVFKDKNMDKIFMHYLHYIGFINKEFEDCVSGVKTEDRFSVRQIWAILI